MHREITYADQSFQKESRLSLYLFTALIGLLLFAGVWPAIAAWIATWGPQLPTWPATFRLFGTEYEIVLIAAVLGGARILYGSLDALFEGRVGADLALAIACVAAILIKERFVAAEIVFIGLVGECLESITFERTQRAIRRIVEIFPRRCWRLREGQEERVLVSELRVGDMIVVKPGARVPADGIVREGLSAVDVSALTGESLPADKGPGDEVLAGSLNQFGALTIEALRVAEHTVAGRVIEMTARALKDKSPIERTADRLARYFLPTVLGLATLTFFVALVGQTLFSRTPTGGRPEILELVTKATPPALAVLVVACPCALILATPAAVIAAMGRLAGTGVLLKGGSALERLARVNAFAFDKTGTLTEGRLELGEVVPFEGVSADELLRTAATAEQRSEHILARLILQEAAHRELSLDPMEEFQAHPGSGVTTRGAGATLTVGNRRLLQEQGINLSPEVEAVLQRLDAEGQTVLLVARDGQLLGAIGARDKVRPEAAAVLAELRSLGITDLAMLTGDREAVARHVAAPLGLTEVRAELLPEQKAEFIASWQERDDSQSPDREGGVKPQPPLLTLGALRVLGGPRRVAMVGDGINDAPALARADVGLAIGSGAEIAAEAGDIVFMGDPLRHLPLLVRLSRETVRIIRQNILFFAIGVNVVGIVLTAWLWPLVAPEAWYGQSPVAAVLYHQLGSLAVLLNAMRLLWFERAASSPTWQSLSQRARAVSDWLDHRFDLDEGLHWLAHQWRPVVSGLIVLVLLAWALSGLTQVGPDEVAVVRRFGRPLEEDFGPGLHWRWPWPVEEVTRIQPERLYTVEIGFRSQPGSQSAVAARAWSSTHGNDGLRRMPDEAVMITGDNNLIELQGTVRFHLSNPRAYLFEVGDLPVESGKLPGLLRSAAESVLRETIAGMTFAELLTSDRERFHDLVLQRLRERCKTDGLDGLGVRLEGLSLHDLHPPQEVVQAYHDVTQAMEYRDQRVNQAIADAYLAEREQQAKSLETVRQAEAARIKTVSQAAANLDAFLARYRARGRLSWRQEWEIFRDVVLAGTLDQKPEQLARDYLRRRGEAIARQEVLSDFRRYWDAMTEALTGREKVVIDAEKVPGRRHLWLLPFEPFRFPLPGMGLPERSPMNQPRGRRDDEP
jgi:Cu+-exporting ATPase